MPIVNRAHASSVPEMLSLASGQLPDAPTVENPSVGSVIGAAWRQSNVIGSALAAEAGGLFGASNDGQGETPDYSAWDEIKGTPYENHWDAFADSNSPAYTAALKRQLDMEDRDRQTIAASGWTGTIANFGANVVDPTILIPVGGEILKGSQGAYKIADVALRSSIAAGTSTAVQETGLHATQQERTLNESAWAVGGAVILGGLLGGSVSALLSRGERDVAMKGYDGLLPTEGGGGLSAAPVVHNLGIDALTVDGTMAGGIAKGTQFLSPNMRLNFSPSAEARQIGQSLAEGTMYQVGHAEGLTVGPSVERLAGMNERARMVTGVQSLNNAYKDMRKAGISMKFDDFDQAVGRAMRAEDKGENDFVSRAARELRASVVEPFFKDGQHVGLYDEGDDVSFAPSYFPRQYRTKVLIAKEPEVKAEWQAHMEGHIGAKYQADAEALRAKHAELDQQVSDLNLSPEDRVAAMAKVEGDVSALEAANPDHLDRIAQINELRRSKPSGYQEKIAAIRDEGGKAFADFQKTRGNLRSRLERIDFGYAGLEDRQARLAGSIAKVEDANQRGLRRLVAKGEGLQKLKGKLDPKKLDKQLSSLRTSFADVLARSERGMDRTARAAERLGEDAPAGMAARLEAEAKTQAARHERLTRLADQIDRAESLDPAARLKAANDAIDQLVSEVADVTVRRGEKAARLVERQKAMDPAKIAGQVAKIAERKAQLLRALYDKWEIRNLGENIDPFDPGILPRFKEMAKEIVDEVYDKLTGRNYGSSASVAPEYLTPIERGPVKERTLPIPDWMLAKQGVLNDRASEVLHRYSRTLSADIELTRRFGDPRLDAVLKRLHDEYAKLREGVTDPNALRALDRRQRHDQRDIEALRDLIRGTYKAAENASTFGRVVRAASHANFVTKMGGVVVSSLSDLYRIPMVHGLARFMGQGIAPLLRNANAVKLSVKEARLAGTVVDTVLAHRMTSLSGIADPLERGNPLERALQSMSAFGAKWTGLNLWTDSMKAITAIMSQNRILDGSANARTLAFLGIDGDTAKSIRAEFATHGEVMDGVHVANTERWTNQDAVRAFRAAVGKDVDSIIVTPGVGDVPLFVHSPLGRLLLQFRSFMFASHQRVLLRGLQENKARFASGMVGMTTLGILSAYLRSWRGGQSRHDKWMQAAQNPGFVIGEGLDGSGLFTLPFDAANTTEKLTQSAGFSFNPIKSPMMMAGSLAVPQAPHTGESIRFATRSPLSIAAGPTGGLIEDAAKAASGGVAALNGKHVANSQRDAALRLLPFSSFYGMKEAIQALNGDSPYAPLVQPQPHEGTADAL